jgi:hypothetical protein
MFWGKKPAKEEGKLSGPKEIPGPVQNYLVAERKMDPVLVKLLRAVECKSTTGATFNIRVFDNSEAIVPIPMIPATYSDPFRPPIPDDSGHPPGGRRWS